MKEVEVNYLEYIESNMMSAELMPDKFPFVKHGWVGHVLLSGNYFLRKDFLKLRAAIQRVVDDKDIFVVDYGLYEDFLSEDLIERANENAFWEIPFSWDEFDDLVQHCEYGTTGIYLWGRSLSWGVIAPDYNFNCIGGSPEVIESIEREFGGYDVIEQELSDWLHENPDKFGGRLYQCFYKK